MKSIAALLLCLLFAIPFSLRAQTVEEGIALSGNGRLEEAKKVFEAVITIDEKNAEAHYRLGRILLTRSLRNEDEAIEQMERAVDIDPANADYQYGLGAAYGLKAQNAGVLKQVFLAPKVKKAFERAVALNPRHIEARAGLAQYYFRAPGIMGGDMEKAWMEADTMITLDEVRGRAFKARLYESEKKSREAEEEYKTLLAHQPKNWQAWQAAGGYYLRRGQPDDAIPCFERYTQLRPDTAHSFYLLAWAYLQKKDADRALAAVKKSFALDADYAPGFNVLAQAYELKGEKKEARENYQRMLKSDLGPEQRKNIEKKIKELE
jgi:tetratricopeptide (TPR) repeat protein